MRVTAAPLALSTALAAVLCVSRALPALAQTRLEGTVYDSIARRPLGGATVQLYGPTDRPDHATHTVRADSLGRFAIDSLARGSYVAGFFHPSTDSLGLEFPSRTVELRGDRQRLALATPSGASLRRMLCPGLARNDSSGVIVGHVRDAHAESPIDRASVDFEWQAFSIEATGLRTREHRATSETSEPGWFAICGVPAGTELFGRAHVGTDTTGYIQLDLPPLGLQHVTLYLDQASSDSGRAAQPARLSGTVVDEHGAPVPNASVSVWQTSGSATTNDRGAFTIDSLTGGTRTIEVRAIGFTPAHVAVRLASGERTTTTVTLARAVVLSAVEATAKMTESTELLWSKNLVAFEHHKKSSAGGYFRRPTDLEKGTVAPIAQIARTPVGVDVGLDKYGEWYIYMKKQGMKMPGGAQRCTPPVFVDGIRSMLSFNDIVTDIRGDDLLAVEVYSHYNEVPSEYQMSAFDACGAVVVWRAPPKTKLPKPDSTTTPPPSDHSTRIQ